MAAQRKYPEELRERAVKMVLESVFAMPAVMCGHGFCPLVAAGVARGSTVRGPGWRGGSSFLTGRRAAVGNAAAGAKTVTRGFPVTVCFVAEFGREFRAGFLGALRVALAARDVQGAQGSACRGVRCGGD